jgi:hypothetical protein
LDQILDKDMLPENIKEANLVKENTQVEDQSLNNERNF